MGQRGGHGFDFLFKISQKNQKKILNAAAPQPNGAASPSATSTQRHRRLNARVAQVERGHIRVGTGPGLDRRG
jgi:hypothetical protein